MIRSLALMTSRSSLLSNHPDDIYYVGYIALVPQSTAFPVARFRVRLEVSILCLNSHRRKNVDNDR
jgi:hypothetical protein